MARGGRGPHGDERLRLHGHQAVPLAVAAHGRCWHGRRAQRRLLACGTCARGGAEVVWAALGCGMTTGWAPWWRVLFAGSTRTRRPQRLPHLVAAAVYGSRCVACLCRPMLVALVGGL